jgi:ammonium transporter, Amt family
LGIQFIAVVATAIYTFVLSYILLKVIDKIFGLRVSEQEEIGGLDLSQHDETAYSS